jgi:hypothetical protein
MQKADADYTPGYSHIPSLISGRVHLKYLAGSGIADAECFHHATWNVPSAHVRRLVGSKRPAGRLDLP